MTLSPEAISANLTEQLRGLCVKCRRNACIDLNRSLLERNWNIGRIMFDNLSVMLDDDGDEDSIRMLDEIEDIVVQQFDSATLITCLRFYLDHRGTQSTISGHNTLTWPHYRVLYYIDDAEQRSWFETQAVSNGWSVRDLMDAVSSKYRVGDVNSGITHDRNFSSDDMDVFVKDSDVLGFLGANDHRGPLAEPRRRIMDIVSDHLIGLERGYALVFRNKASVLKGETYETDLVFFNYILDCFILVDFMAHEPDEIDCGRMIKSIDAFNRRSRPKGKKPTLGILIGIGGGLMHLKPAMKFNQTNIKAFYGTYRECIWDFEGAYYTLVEQMTPYEISVGMRGAYDLRQ